MSPKKSGSNKMTFFDTLDYFVKNGKSLRAMPLIDKARFSLQLANIELAKLSFQDPTYIERLYDFDRGMIELIKGKWFAARAMESHLRSDWDQAFRSLKNAKISGEDIIGKIARGDKKQVLQTTTAISSNDTEILFAENVPIVPEINPIVILQGNDFEMGFQYAQQVIQIFGAWVMKRKAGRVFSEVEIKCIHLWEDQIKQFAPEILEMCKGWAAGANEAGIPMSYLDVLEIWTGHEPPAENYMAVQPGKPREIPLPACSGVAAWGRATPDGKLVAGASGDHDCTFMVTIVAYPETGNAFVYTPFSVTGDVPEVGQVFMMGHPGMNNKGLAYVEHGGEMRMLEAKETWGYGIRRATAVLHILRFANNARQALDMELALPVGDVGRAMGSTGGFFADSSYGYVAESRHSPTMIRESGLLGETDFLYANNSAMHPDAKNSGWMKDSLEDWVWDVHGGWYPKAFSAFSLISAMKMKPEKRFLIALSNMYMNSCGRGKAAFERLNRNVGKITEKQIKAMYQESGTFPPGSIKEIRKRYNQTGTWGAYSIGHATNALVAILKPDNGDNGNYSLCVGTAARGLTPNSPTRATPIYHETNSFWQIKLADSPKTMVEAARRLAEDNIVLAKDKLATFQLPRNSQDHLTGLFNSANQELRQGQVFYESAGISKGHQQILDFSRALRCFTRAQVKALQISQAK